MNLHVAPRPMTAPAGSLAGLRVLITGAGSGIGHATAKRFIDGGATVGVHCRTETSPFDGDPVTVLEADLRDHEARRTLVGRFADAAGGLDVLVNNAGAVPAFAPFREIDDDILGETFEINAFAPFRLIAEAWPYMEAQGGGRVVNIGTAAVKYGGGPRGVHYVAAKGALDAMTIAFAKAGAACGIRVNGVRCGLIDSGMHRKVPGYTDDDFADRAALVPIGRAGTVEEVAELVAYLASPAADFITGQLIDIAGGD